VNGEGKARVLFGNDCVKIFVCKIWLIGLELGVVDICVKVLAWFEVAVFGKGY